MTPTPSPTRDLVVIGASAGGVQALTELLGALPKDLPAAVLIVVHTSPTSPGILPQILDRAGPLTASHATDCEPIRPGRVYVAPPDHHLLIKHGNRNGKLAPSHSPDNGDGDNGNGDETGISDGDKTGTRSVTHNPHPGTAPLFLRIVRGPKENGFRPAVDPLFRTAARVAGPRSIGVVLSGGLDDGTEGLALIKTYGGATLVQDPAEAHFPSMPSSAIAHVDVDHVATVREIARLVTQLAREPLPEGAFTMPTQDGDQPDVAEVGDTSLANGDIPVPPSGFTCPECGGALWELSAGRLLKFRCHVGHSYSADGLVAEQTRDLEASLWTALRALEESAALRRRMAQRARRGTWPVVAEDYQRQAEDAEARAALIRRTLMSGDPANETIRASSPGPEPKWDGRLYGPNGKSAPDRSAPRKSPAAKSRRISSPSPDTTPKRAKTRPTPSKPKSTKTARRTA